MTPEAFLAAAGGREPAVQIPDADDVTVVAVVVPEPDTEGSPKQLCDFGCRSLRGSRTSAQIGYRDQLPTTAAGQVIRREIIADVHACCDTATGRMRSAPSRCDIHMRLRHQLFASTTSLESPQSTVTDEEDHNEIYGGTYSGLLGYSGSTLHRDRDC